MSFLNIALGNYYPAESTVHRLDPRLKIVSLAALMLITFAVSNSAAVGLHTAVVLGAVILSNIPLRVFYRGLRLFVFLFFFTAVLHLFFTPGTPLVGITDPVYI